MVKVTTAQSSQARLNGMTSAREVTTSNGAVSADPVVAVPLTPYDDAYKFNLTFDWENEPGVPTHILDLVGSTVRGVPVLPHGPNQPGTVAWQMDSGASLTPKKGVITYSFLDSGHTTGMYNNPKEGFTEGFGYTSFSAEQRVAARIAIGTWDELVSVSFKEVNGDGNSQITLANTTTGPAQAHAYIPHDYVGIYGVNYLNRWKKFLGDVWVADPYDPVVGNPSNAQLNPGQYGVQTLNHELGHSLGLSHPGSYDFGDDLDGDGEPDPITYKGDAQYFQDSHQFTIMSYFDSYETGAQWIDWNLMRFTYSSTPMVDDVFVIQQKYGADTTTRTGNSTYGFAWSADITNEAFKFRAGEQLPVFTIWDAGGTDTLNLSGYYTPSIIDLREGAYSSAGGVGAYVPSELGDKLTLAQINENNADLGYAPRTERLYEIYHNGGYSDPATEPGGQPTLVNEGLSWKEITGTSDQYLMEQNIGIAYGAVIENAVGGHGNDRINGNYVNNDFTGGAGDDTFIIADHSMVLPKLGGGTRSVADNSTDEIMDFGNGNDTLDLTSFAGLDLNDVLWTDATDTLLINTDNDAAYEVTVLIHGTFTTGDILFA